MWFFAAVAILLVVLMGLTRVKEGFLDMPTLPEMPTIPDMPMPTIDFSALKKLPGMTGLPNIAGPNIDTGKIPEPQKLFKHMRSLLDKYDKPEVWGHAAHVMDKDPGQLARMELGIINE